MKLLLIHTYIFINYKIIKDIYISDCKRYLKIDNNSNILSILDLPNNEKLYKINLIHLSSSINNLKIEIELDYTKLLELTALNKPIPEKNKLLKILKRNYFFNYKSPTIFNDLSLSRIKPKKIEFIKDNFLILKDLVFDFSKKTIHLKKNKLDIYQEKNLLILNSKPNINIFNNLHLKKKDMLIIFCKDQSQLLKYYFRDSKYYVIEKNDKCIQQNIKLNNRTLIEIGVLKELFQNQIESDFKNKVWSNIILIDIYKKKTLDIIKSLINYKSLIIINHKENLNYSTYFNFITNNSCQLNIDKFNSCIFDLKQNSIKYTKKNFEKYNLYPKLISKIILHSDKNQQKLYQSLPENIVQFHKLPKNNYNKLSCCICLGKISKCKLIKTKCNHFFCDSCILTHLTNSKKCPLCRTPIDTSNLFRNTDLYSNKIQHIFKTSKHNEPYLIISYYNKSISTLASICEHKKINYRIITSSFNNKVDSSIKLFLVNTKNLLKIKNFNLFNKILFLENNYDSFDYCKFMLIDYKNFHKKVEILAHN